MAVKLLAEHLAEDEAFVARFRREALSAAKLQHPNIVQVFDSGKDPDSERHYIVMEFVEGPSCADLIREEKELGVEQAVRYVGDACHGLDYAHRAGVIHRDVKPGNLLVSNEADAVKLADFGIAKAAEQTRITQVGLGARHGRLPVARAGSRRGGRARVRRLLARRMRVPVPRRPAAARVQLDHRARAEAAERRGRLDPDLAARGPRRARPRDPGRAPRRARRSATARRSRWREAVAAGARGEDTEATMRLAADGVRR